MKIIRQNETCLLRLSQAEWNDIGKEQGWLTQEQQQQLYPPDSPATRPSFPTGDRMNVRVVQETGQAFAIYLAGDADVAGKPIYVEQLLCTLTKHQDALAVKALLDDMAERIAKGRDREGVLERHLRGNNRT